MRRTEFGDGLWSGGKGSAVESLDSLYIPCQDTSITFVPFFHQTARNHLCLRIAVETIQYTTISQSIENDLLRHARTAPLTARLHGLQYRPATVALHERRVSEL